MPPKRKRNGPVGTNGLVSSVKLKSGGCWGWVSSEVRDVDDIALEHRMTASNLSMRNGNPLCRNKYAVGGQESPVLDAASPAPDVNGELSEDVIVVSDTDEPLCTKKACKRNPYCLNYLGQEMWEDEDVAWENFSEAAKLGEDPALLSREADVPVGLKNLGATCYANASLQVWFRFAAFRAGVYACEPPHNMAEEKYKESPVSQLQVTFAALQAGDQKVFNPTKLVESLQLRTSEQQDAQEFSKLFMTHLDAEFKKQNSESLKTLITNQFQGTQVYGTICQSCKYRSETSSEFLEIEVSFKNNAKLEDCISTSLLPETLSGENRYLCSGCRALQNATRYTELQILPPVLHFSLMRFVYDLNTMERKKSKHSISFPHSLDMNKFLGSPESRRHATSTAGGDNVYELRGILLHKGASAYHGHYEAQVYDAQHESWFLFNDELVTKINGLGDKIPQKQGNHRETAEEDEKVDPLDVRKKRRKRRRIDDSDDGDDDVVEVKKTTLLTRSESIITSKDAYMLIYAKRDSTPFSGGGHKDPALFQQPEPPNRALKVVQAFNDEHAAACNAYVHKEAAVRARFTDVRSKMRAIYRTWNSTPNMGCVVVSRQALESWILTHCIAANSKQSFTTGFTGSENLAEQDRIFIACSDIICEHGFLDPKKSDDMKCITPDAYQRAAIDTNCKFSPMLESSQVCSECVSFEFPERLYQVEHPRYVKLVDEVCNVAEGESGYWVSKKWYKDWRLAKPKLHVACHEDPGPDSVEFHNHVYCEHGCLTLNSTNRRKMSAQAVDLLKTLFPQWEPLYTDVEPCAVCEAEITLSKEDRREVRRRVEDEKARLRFLLDSTLDMWTKEDEEGSYAVLSTQFVKNWKRWVFNPMEQQRPEGIDNAQFFCHHELLAIDLNYPSDLDSSIMIIQRDEWDVLNSIYEGGPLIALSKKVSETGGYQQDMPVCEGCRIRRKTEWDTADIVIRHIDPNTTSKNKPIIVYGRGSGVRQSKRLRPIKEDGKRRHITVSKSTTVKDIKIKVQEEFSLPTISQRLFLRGQELEDNNATVGFLQILANDTVDLREAEEVVDLTSDNDETPTRKKKKEGNGFSGTLLGNADAPWSSSPEQTPYQTDLVKECPKCTLSNHPEALSCEACHAHFA